MLAWLAGQGIHMWADAIGHTPVTQLTRDLPAYFPALDEQGFRSTLARRIEELAVAAARSEVERFLTDPASVSVWSREFFLAVANRVRIQS